MTHTIQAPWPARRLSEKDMRTAILAQVVDKACWQSGKYLGSMLYFDFGGKVEIPSVRQGMIVQGEAMLGIRDCFWLLLKNEAVVVDSDSISDENALEKLRCVQGALLLDFFVPKKGIVNFAFSNNVVLSLDTTNRYVTQDDIAEFVAPDGKIYAITPRGHFYISDEVTKIRFVPQEEAVQQKT